MSKTVKDKLQALFDAANKSSNYYSQGKKCSLTVADKTAGSKTTPKIIFSHRGSELTYGASTPKFALILAAYKLKEALATLHPKPKSIAGYESAFFAKYKVSQGGSKRKPKIDQLFTISSSTLQFSSRAKKALDDHSSNSQATWLMLNLGNYIYHQFVKLGVQKHFQLNKTYGGKTYLIPGKGSHNLTSDAAVKVLNFMVKDPAVSKGIDNHAGGGCYVGVDWDTDIRYVKCGIYSSYLHEAWVYKNKNYVACLLSKGITSKYNEIAEAIDKILRS